MEDATPLLFMDSLPTQPGQAAWDDVEALTHVLHDGETPESLAEYLKGKGNAELARGPEFYASAEAFYTRAIDAGSKVAANVSVYYSNRAAVHARRGNWGSALRDARAALERNPANAKAMFRGAEAALQLARRDDARDFLARALAAEPDSPTFAKMRARLAEADARAARAEDARAKKARDDAAREADARRMCRERGVRLGHPLVALGAYGGGGGGGGGEEEAAELRVRDVVRRDEASGEMVWRVGFLFEEPRLADWVDSFYESASLADQLSEMMPPAAPPRPWDARGEYRLDNLAAYFVIGWTSPLDEPRMTKLQMLARRGVRPQRVSLHIPLEQILAAPDYLVPGNPIFIIVSREFEPTFLRQDILLDW